MVVSAPNGSDHHTQLTALLRSGSMCPLPTNYFWLSTTSKDLDLPCCWPQLFIDATFNVDRRSAFPYRLINLIHFINGTNTNHQPTRTYQHQPRALLGPAPRPTPTILLHRSHLRGNSSLRRLELHLCRGRMLAHRLGRRGLLRTVLVPPRHLWPLPPLRKRTFD
jgi:hypothetical protein